MFGALRDGGSGYVYVRAAISLVGENEVNGRGPFFFFGFFVVGQHFATEGDPNIEEISETIQAVANKDPELHGKLIELSKDGQQVVTNYLFDYVHAKYEAHEKEVGSENMRKLERHVLLRTIDELWMDHIDTMEYLRDSVNLRAYGQRDPLVEYKVEAQKLFATLTETIKHQVANLIFKVGFVQQPKEVKMEEGRANIGMEKTAAQTESEKNNQPVKKDEHEVGRNDPCWCGSGKKFKKCHGA